MTVLAMALAAAAAAAPAPSAAPDWYRPLAGVHWVVKDLDRVKEGWGKLGFPAVADFGEVELFSRVRGNAVSARLRVAMTLMGPVPVYWLQPLGDGGAYGEFLKAHGEGIFSLNHAAPTRAALDAEVARLQALGVGVLQSSDVDTGEGTLRILHMDTRGPGKWTLGLVHGAVPGAPAGGAAAPFGARLSHVAVVARELDGPSAFWSRLGLPPLKPSRTPVTDRVFRGQPGTFDQELAWQRHTSVALEWVRSLAGPTTYDEFLQAHGEGIHHLGFEVDDFDKAVAAWAAAGFPVVQSGSWGDAGKPGSGRYAYLDADAAGGVIVEVLWTRR